MRAILVDANGFNEAENIVWILIVHCILSINNNIRSYYYVGLSN